MDVIKVLAESTIKIEEVMLEPDSDAEEGVWNCTEGGKPYSLKYKVKQEDDEEDPLAADNETFVTKSEWSVDLFDVDKLNDDSHCMLVEFCNESRQLAVGFTAWLKEEDRSNISFLIDSGKQVEVLWPECDAKSARAMRNVLKNCKPEQWHKYAIQIIECGKWTDMTRKLNLILKSDVANTTRETRKNTMKKNVEEKKDLTESKNSKQCRRKKEVTKRKRILDSVKESIKKGYVLSNSDMSSTEMENIDFIEKEPVQKKKRVHTEEIVTSENEEIALDEEKSDQIRILERKLIDIQTKNKLLEMKLALTIAEKESAVSAMQTKVAEIQLSKELLMKRISSCTCNDLRETIVNQQKTMSILEEKNCALQKELNIYKDITMANNETHILLENLKASTQIIRERTITIFDAEKVEQNKKNIQQETTLIVSDSSESIMVEPSLNHLTFVNKEAEAMEKTSTKEISNPDDTMTSAPNLPCVTDDGSEQNIGYGVLVHTDVLRSIRKKDVRAALRDLLTAVFSEHEFATCSISGKKNKGGKIKPKLDEKKLLAILEYVLKLFPNQHEETVSALLIQCARNKCSNCRKNSNGTDTQNNDITKVE